MITVVEHDGGIEVECGSCRARESGIDSRDIAGFVLTDNGELGVHCCWCGRDGAGLLEGSGDELQSGA